MKTTNFKTTKEYLDYYLNVLKENFEVVFHAHSRMSWGKNRKIYGGVMDEEFCPYNHRSILSNEVVFDFDGTKEENKINSKKLMKIFDEQNVNYSAWLTSKTSGGIHIHTLWKNLNKVSQPKIFKNIILKTYARGMKIDYQLAGKHLIRAEHGLYEKTYPVHEHHKTLIKDNNGLSFNVIPSFLFKIYIDETKKNLVRDLKKVKGHDFDDEKIVKLLNGEIKIKDGRERILFYLIHILKTKFDFDEVVKKLQGWYQYNGGYKLTKNQIRNKVIYHWKRKYSFSKNYLDNFIK